MIRALSLIILAIAFGLVGYVAYDNYVDSPRPLAETFEREWRADVEHMMASGKLPPTWADVREIRLIGGNPPTKNLLKHVTPPLSTRKDGQHRLEILVVLWTEDHKRGALVQYDFENLKTRNTTLEISRTLILDDAVR